MPENDTRETRNDASADEPRNQPHGDGPDHGQHPAAQQPSEARLRGDPSEQPVGGGDEGQADGAPFGLVPIEAPVGHAPDEHVCERAAEVVRLLQPGVHALRADR